MMWSRVCVAVLVALLSIASVCTISNAQESAFDSAPIYMFSFNSAATTPSTVEWQSGRGSNLGLAYFNGINHLINLTTTNDDRGRTFPQLGSSFTIEAWMSYENFQSYSQWFALGNGQWLDNIYVGNTGSAITGSISGAGSQLLSSPLYYYLIPTVFGWIFTGNAVRFGTVFNPFNNDTNRAEAVISRANQYSVGVFSHIVASCNVAATNDTTNQGSVLSLYVNGALVGNTTQFTTPFKNRVHQTLGKSAWTADGLFNGWMDSVMVYNYGLSDQAVFAHSVLSRVPAFELAFSEDPRQIAGSDATYGFVLADPDDVTANVSQWHQGVVTLDGISQYMSLSTATGSSTSGTTLGNFGGDGYGTGSNNYQQGWSFEFTFKVPVINSGAKIFDSVGSSGNRVYLGLDGNSLVFYLQSGTNSATASTIISTVSTNTWYHVVVVVVPINIAQGTGQHVFYVNGAFVSNATSVAYPSSVARTTYIGKSTSSSETTFARLVFDLVRIYDYALTNNTVLKLYYSVSQAAPTNPTPPLTLYTTAPQNFYSFDAQSQSTGYSQYYFINDTNDGHFGVAAFNGVNTSVNLQYFPDANGNLFSDYIGGGSMTFSVWAKWLDVAVWSRIFDFAGRLAESDNNIVLSNMDQTTTLMFQVYSGSTATSVRIDEAVRPGEWQHIVCVVNQVDTNLTSPLAANMSVYINGVLRGNTLGYIPPRVLRSNLLVARSNWNADARFRGYIDSLAFYEYALNPQQVAAHSCTSRPPIFEFAFDRDPRIDTSVTYGYGWTDSETEIIPANTPYLNPTNANITFTHTGLLTFSGASQYVNLTATSGPNNIGNQLPVIGGQGSGVGYYVGWTLEILFKANSRGNWAKIIDFGVNTNGDDDIILGFDGDQNLSFEIWNSRVRVNNNPKSVRMVVIPSAQFQLGKWYHIVIVMTPTNVTTASAIWTPYVNNEVNDASTVGVWPDAIQRTNANIGKSNWGADPYFNGAIDSLRIYDYAVSEDSVRGLYRATRSVPPPAPPAALYHPNTMNSYSFERGYDPAQASVANFIWRESYDGHSGIAYFDGTNQYVNLLGYTDSRQRSFPIAFGGTDLTFSGWARYDATRTWCRIFDISGGQGINTLALLSTENSGLIGLHIYTSRGNSIFPTTVAWPVAQWFHYVVRITRNPTADITGAQAAAYNIYINGTGVFSGVGYYPDYTQRLKVYLGRSGWAADQYFNGAMDTFNWYDYSLPFESISLHSQLITPPYFELTFNTDPRVTAASISPTFAYSWVDRDPSDSPNSVHQGLLDLTNAQGQYVNLMQATGNYSIGAVLPTIGGVSSGTDTSSGWSFEVVFKLRNVSSSRNFCKVFDSGNGANPSGLLGDDNVAIGLRQNGEFAFEIFNSRTSSQTILSLISSTQANTWYSVVVVMQPTDTQNFRALFNGYVNGLAVQPVTGSYLQGIYREAAYLGKSEWANDPLCDMQLDAIRIYDYALASSDVVMLTARTVDAVVPRSSSSSSSTGGTTGPVQSSSSSSATKVDIGCRFQGNVASGSILASLIFSLPLTSYSSNFGSQLQQTLAAVINGAMGTNILNSADFGCVRASDAMGRVSSVDPTGSQSKVEFYLLNGASVSPAQMYQVLSTNPGAVGSYMTLNFAFSVTTTNLENVDASAGGSDSSLGGGAIAGIVIGVIVGVILLIGLGYWFLSGGSRKSYSYADKHDHANHSYDNQTDDHDHEHETGTGDEEVELQDVTD